MKPTATELINSGKKNAARYTLVIGPGRFTSTARNSPSALPSSAPGMVKKKVMRNALWKWRSFRPRT